MSLPPKKNIQNTVAPQEKNHDRWRQNKKKKPEEKKNKEKKTSKSQEEKKKKEKIHVHWLAGWLAGKIFLHRPTYRQTDVYAFDTYISILTAG